MREPKTFNYPRLYAVQPEDVPYGHGHTEEFRIIYPDGRVEHTDGNMNTWEIPGWAYESISENFSQDEVLANNPILIVNMMKNFDLRTGRETLFLGELK